MSLNAPDLVTNTFTPSRWRSSATTGRMEMTPMEPTTAVGMATILVAAQLTRYPPERPTPARRR